MPLAKTPNELIEMLNESGLSKECPIQGCTEKDIVEIEEKYRVKLPQAYKDFLLLLGDKPGHFLPNCLFRKSELDTIKDIAQKQVKEDGATLKETDFVFMQRYNFVLYFENEGNLEDPPVYLLEKGRDQSRQLFESLSKWLYSWINLDIESLQKYQP